MSVSSRYVEMINGLHATWTPHDGQIQIGKALFNDGKDIFSQCGRNWGKTEFVCYVLWRWAFSNPGSENYYFAPYMKQAREILWASGRLQSFAPKEWIKDINYSEMRITLTNGSFIKLDGSDNVEAYRGVKPRGISVFDEFKDFRPEFYDAYDPNRAAHNSPLIIIGTPPDRECQFVKIADVFKNDPDKIFYQGPTHVNPHISKEWLAKKEKELVLKGEEDVWQREYLAEYVPGGASKIFPQISVQYVYPHAQLIREVDADRKKLEFLCIADPGAATTFGVLFVALNPYTKVWYVLDEIYEQDQSRMSTRQVGSEVGKKRLELMQDSRVEWRNIFDEAAQWFANEMLDNFEEAWEPTHKSVRKKETSISIVRDILVHEKIKISDRAKEFFGEMDNYFKDKNGNIPKLRDHLIDAFRYAIDAVHYELREEGEYLESEDENFRGARISDDFPELNDWGERVSEGYLDH